MHFYEYRTLWDRLRRPRQKAYKDDVAAFYKKQLRIAKNQGLIVRQTEFPLEAAWCHRQKPYYKIYPRMVHDLATTSIDLPVSDFQVPYEVFGVYLPANNNPLLNAYRDDGPSVRSFLVCHAVGESVVGADSLLVIAASLDDNTTLVLSGSLDDCSTIEGWSNKVRSSNGAMPGPLARVVTRLALGTAMLAVNRNDNHEYFEHDIVGKLQHAYDNATTDQEREEIARDSEGSNGRKGWCVGRALRLERDHSGDLSVCTERHLTHRHYRAAHWKRVRYGPGRKLVKRMFILGTIVRPDLPVLPYEMATV